jgi:hypothetical protein
LSKVVNALNMCISRFFCTILQTGYITSPKIRMRVSGSCTGAHVPLGWWF